MRRIGFLLAFAGCTPNTPGLTTEDVMLSTGDSSSTTNDSGIQTVTGAQNTTSSDPTDPTSDSQPLTSTSLTEGSSSSATLGSTTEPIGMCGNGIVEGIEICDDGNNDQMDECTSICRPPACGDTFVQKGEDCDDGNTDNTDSCTNGCIGAYCGDSYIQGTEACDDGNDSNEDTCLKNCTKALCGDGFVNMGVEACDDGFNDGTYNSCMPGCLSKGPYCGDGHVDKVDPNKSKGFEYCDTLDPYPQSVGCTDDCLYDFSSAPQLYCAGVCSWGGNSGCDQSDADILCRLKTGIPNSKATAFTMGIPIEAGGFPCSNPDIGVKLNGTDPRIWLGTLPEFGLGNKDVPYQLNKLKTAHTPYALESIILGDATLKCSGI